MTRRIIGVLGGVTSAALIATAFQVPAVATPHEDELQPRDSVRGKEHDRPDAMEERRRAGKQRALELLVEGKREPQQRGGSESVRVGPDEWVEYAVEKSERLLSFLVEFGGEQKGRRGPRGGGGRGHRVEGRDGDLDQREDHRRRGGDDQPTDPTKFGPLHNQIPEPGPEDNSTYWKPDFNRGHYMDMFFNGMADQGGESFKGVYEEMSSGRYTVTGDVSDWVRVDKPEAAYGTTESHEDMTYFIDDTAEAWYKAQRRKGMSPKRIREYLQSFDIWDRYDHDGDGDFAEPDGYIDHFQAIHAGEGEEAGAPEWTIWSHRWAVNQNGFHEDGVGPEGAEYGGIEIGDTGLWIRDYTTEPENGGLGVFVHEYAHDLGLPDFYDTEGGENGTAFWTLMSSGSWLSHGDGAIGTTPNQMGPWEKLQLGWLDYEVLTPGESGSYDLGPSFREIKNTAQAVLAVLPEKSRSYDLGPAAEGTDYFYSGRGDDRTATLTSPQFTVPAAGQLAAQAKYDIEVDWDYAYVEVSTDGQAWQPVQTNLSTSEDPNAANEGFGITGSSGDAWVPLTADLSAFAGQDVQLRFRMENDAYTNELGFMVDAITITGVEGEVLAEGAEDGAPTWKMDKFLIAENGSYDRAYSHYYIAENRGYDGYDRVLAEGPYNFGWGASNPDKVEHYPYQDGLLVWYWDTEFTDNNTSAHPGGGQALPIDARPAALTWSDGTLVRNRIQSFDATFGLEPTDPISLHRETATGTMTTLDVPSQEAVPVFDDTDPMAYYDTDNPGHSAIVGGTGTRIEVSGQEPNGIMHVKVSVGGDPAPE